MKILNTQAFTTFLSTARFITITLGMPSPSKAPSRGRGFWGEG